MLTPFRIKTVNGKKVKRMTGSSRLKPEKRKEQRQLRKNKDWRGLIERYKVRNTRYGSQIEIIQSAYKEPLTIRFWADVDLRKKLSTFSIVEMGKDDLVILSKELKIPLRIIASLQAKEKERERRAANFIKKFKE